MAKTAVFIDVPNVCLGRAVKPKNINWQRLSLEIAKTLADDDEVIWSGAYALGQGFTATAAERAKTEFRPLFGAHFDPIIRLDKDVDSWIVADMFRVCLNELNEVVAHAVEHSSINLPVHLRLILVSGDNDYTRVFKVLKEHSSELISFTLEVWSWQQTLGNALARYANRIYRLDQFFSFESSETEGEEEYLPVR